MTSNNDAPGSRKPGDALSRQIAALPKSMALTTRRGQIVQFTGIGGSRQDIEDACQTLTLGACYIVLATEVGRRRSHVVLREGRFNTAMFENVS